VGGPEHADLLPSEPKSPYRHAGHDGLDRAAAPRPELRKRVPAVGASGPTVPIPTTSDRPGKAVDDAVFGAAPVGLGWLAPELAGTNANPGPDALARSARPEPSPGEGTRALLSRLSLGPESAADQAPGTSGNDAILSGCPEREPAWAEPHRKSPAVSTPGGRPLLDGQLSAPRGHRRRWSVSVHGRVTELLGDTPACA
jgi:hypothetical protein